jgi:triose/dihydroxyacetone kinase / FAD-AMP lyase (cyclizing)
MDNIAGDGDCGLTLKGGATGTSHNSIMICMCSHYVPPAMLEALSNNSITGNDALGSVITISYR